MARPQAIVPVAAEDSHVRWLNYGDPGVGKTVLIGDLSSRVLILDGDGGDATASAAVRKSKAQKWRMKDWTDMVDAYEYLRHGGVKEFDWVWLDGITLFQEYGLDDIMKTLVLERRHRKVYLPDKGEYGQNMNRIGLWVRDMKDLDIDFGITAHAIYTEDEEGNVTVMPYIQGRGMPSKISGHMGLVTYMGSRRTKDGTERYLLTRKSGKFYAKDRYNITPSGRVTTPDPNKLVADIQRNLGSAAVSRQPAATVKAVAPRRPVAKKATTTPTSK